MEEQTLAQKRIKKLVSACLVLTISGFALLFFAPKNWWGPNVWSLICFFFGFLTGLASLFFIILKKKWLKRKGWLVFSCFVCVLTSLPFILGSLWYFFGPPCCTKTPTSRIVADLSQMRSAAEILYDGDYNDLNLSDPDVAILAEDIKRQGGLLVLHQKDSQYCAYSFLPEQKKEEWYCIDNDGYADYTVINPGQKLYCNENNFRCPPSS